MEKIRKNVQVFIENDKHEILCVSRKDNHTSFGLVGGGIEDYDESPEAAAIREAFEETGYTVNNLKLIHEGMWRDGYQYTFTGDYEGEMNYDEPHVVKWGTAQDLIDGKFGEYNTMILNKLGKI